MCILDSCSSFHCNCNRCQNLFIIGKNDFDWVAYRGAFSQTMVNLLDALVLKAKTWRKAPSRASVRQPKFVGTTTATVCIWSRIKHLFRTYSLNQSELSCVQ